MNLVIGVMHLVQDLSVLQARMLKIMVIANVMDALYQHAAVEVIEQPAQLLKIANV